MQRNTVGVMVRRPVRLSLCMVQTFFALLFAALAGLGLYTYERAQGFNAMPPPVAATHPQPTTPSYATAIFALPSAMGSRSSQTATVVTSIGEGAEQLGIAVTPTAIIEDSRCPLGVACIQAGTVRVETRIGDNWNGAKYVFSLGVPTQIGNRIVELIEVLPNAVSQKTLNPYDYRLTYRITDAASGIQ